MGDSQADANDYSRFENISDSDDDAGTPGIGLTVAERITQIGSAKVAGNAFIAKGEFKQAAIQYRKGIKVVDDLAKANPAPNPAESLETKELELSLHLNLAMAELKLGGWAAARKAAARALRLEPRNAKGLFRRGQAQARAGALDEARRDFAALLELDPANGSAKKELAAVRRKLAEAKAQAKKGFGGLFERAGGMYDDREDERVAREAAKAKAEAEKRAAWEAEMAEQEKEAAAAAAAAAEAGGDAPPPFERTAFAEWSTAQDKKKEEAAKAAEKAKEKAREEARAARLKEEAQKKTTTTTKAAAPEDDEAELDEEDVALLAEIKKKGYCHFRRQQSDDEKALIGDITPKKLDGGGSGGEAGVASPAGTAGTGGHKQRLDNAPAAAAAQRAAGGSAWNQGNTWEEADATGWAKAALKRHLAAGAHTVTAGEKAAGMQLGALLGSMDLQAANEGGGVASNAVAAAGCEACAARVRKVGGVDGDASVAVVRGTKRYLFDLSADLDYEVVVDETSAGSDVEAEAKGGGEEQQEQPPARQQATYRGKIKISDLTHDGDAEVVATPSAKPKAAKVAPHHKAAVEAAVAGLKRDLMERCVAAFVEEFHTSH